MSGPMHLARVADDFTDEYPGADPLAAEAVVNVVRVGERIDAEFSRRLRAEEGISLRAFALLASIDGLGGRSTSAEVSKHIAITTAAITSIVDTCERRGWLVRRPDEVDRRRIWLETTDDARRLLDRLLPGVHQLESELVGALSDAEKRTLVKLLGKIYVGLARAGDEPPCFAAAVRRRPARLDG